MEGPLIVGNGQQRRTAMGKEGISSEYWNSLFMLELWHVVQQICWRASEEGYGTKAEEKCMGWE